MDTQGALQEVRVMNATIYSIVVRCVNALSWAKGGELLISGGDDTT